MPVITIDAVGRITPETKEELIKEVSQLVAQKYEVPLTAITVLIRDLPPENIGQGGKQLKN